MHEDAFHLGGGVPALQIRHQCAVQRIVGGRAGQREVDVVALHGHTRGFHHELIAAMQALQQFAIIQERAFVQIAGVGVDEIPAAVFAGVQAADDVFDRQITVDDTDRVRRKQSFQPFAVKQPGQLAEIFVLDAVDPDGVGGHQLPQAAGLTQFLQVAVHLFVDVLLDFFHIRRAGRGAVELFFERVKHIAQDGGAFLDRVGMQVAEQPHRLRVVDHIVPAAAIFGAALQDVAQRQAVLPGTQPGELFGQLIAVRAKGIFAIERFFRVHAKHRGGVGTGGVVLQDRDALVHF